MSVRVPILAESRLTGSNIHAALLPSNRECNPIHWAIIYHEYETGVTLHEMVNGLNIGPTIARHKCPIFFNDTWFDIRDRLVQSTDVLLSFFLPAILSENSSSKTQLHNQANFGQWQTPYDVVFTWSAPVTDIHNRIRLLVSPLLSALYYTHEDNKIEISEPRTPRHVTLEMYFTGPGGWRHAI